MEMNAKKDANKWNFSNVDAKYCFGTNLMKKEDTIC